MSLQYLVVIFLIITDTSETKGEMSRQIIAEDKSFVVGVQKILRIFVIFNKIFIYTCSDLHLIISISEYTRHGKEILQG